MPGFHDRWPTAAAAALSKAVELDKNLHVVGDVYETPKGRLVVPEPGQR